MNISPQSDKNVEMLLFVTSIDENVFTNREKVVDLPWSVHGNNVVVGSGGAGKNSKNNNFHQCYTIYASDNKKNPTYAHIIKIASQRPYLMRSRRSQSAKHASTSIHAQQRCCGFCMCACTIACVCV